MFDFKNLNDAKKKTQNSDKTRLEQYDQLYNSAITELENFKSTKDKIHLENSVEKLIECISLKRTEPKSYIKLAYIFFVLDEISTSVKYLNAAKSLDNDLPDVVRLQKLISEEKFNL